MNKPRNSTLYDWSRLEDDFKHAVGGLPNYKRTDAFAYVNALRDRITDLEADVCELADLLTIERGSEP